MYVPTVRETALEAVAISGCESSILGGTDLDTDALHVG